MNFLWMDGNNVYVPHSQAEHSTPMDPVFFDNSLTQMEDFQSRVVSITVKSTKIYHVELK